MLSYLLDLLYPPLCLGCNEQPLHKGRSICLACERKIKPTNYHLLEENIVKERFWGRVQIERATSAYTFVKGELLQQLIHQLKYDDRPEIGQELGKLYASMLKEDEFWLTIDYIIPVPLHPQKRHQRGYNQAAEWAKGLSDGLNIPFTEQYLIRTNYTETQTKKSRMDRFANVEHAFAVKHSKDIEGKHLLLVDDVLTTGATLEACALKLLEIEGVRVSIACIALAS